MLKPCLSSARETISRARVRELEEEVGVSCAERETHGSSFEDGKPPLGSVLQLLLGCPVSMHAREVQGRWMIGALQRDMKQYILTRCMALVLLQSAIS